MYGTAITTGTTTGGGLALTGFGVSGFVVIAMMLLVGGMLMIRFGRRRAEAR